MGWKKWLPILGILLFVYILLSLDLSEVIGEIKNANLGFLMIAIFFAFIYLNSQTLKWFVIARAQKIRVPYFKAFVINLKSFFYAFVTPSNIGGLMRAEYLKKYSGDSRGKGVGNFTIDKILDLCSITFLVVLSTLIFVDVARRYIYYLIGLLVLFVISLFIFIDEKKTRKVLGLFRIFYVKLLPDKVKEKIKNGFNSFYSDVPKTKKFVLFFIANLFNWIIMYTMVFFVGLSLGINVSYFYFLSILPIATLIGHIPITINGLGTREAVLIALFRLVDIEATKVFSMSILNLFVSGIMPTIIGGFLIFKDMKKE